MRWPLRSQPRRMRRLRVRYSPEGLGKGIAEGERERELSARR